MLYLLRNAGFAFWRNIYLVLALIALEATVPIFFDINFVTKLILYIYPLYVFHRSILLGAPYSGAPGQDLRLPRRDWPNKPGWRLWVVVISLSSFGIVSTILFYLLFQPILSAAVANEGAVRLFTLSTFFVVHWVLLALYGTAIPAAVINYRTAPSDVQERIRYSFRYCLGGLLILPGVIGAVGLALTTILYLRGIHDFEWSAVSDITVASALAEGAVGLLSYFSMAAAAAVLSEAYLRALERTGQNVASEH